MMLRSLKMLVIGFLLLVVALPASGLAAVGAESRQEFLTRQGYLLWQRVNEARLNPREAMRRLGVSLEQAKASLGDDAWILDRGLPPLAWSEQLHGAALGHGRDMLAQGYYGHLSPQGLGPMERIAATGYQASREDETLGALVFGGYVDAQMAVDYMMDTLIRDELLATPGVRRNIFATDLSEVGIGFFAESVAVVEGNPYVCLFVLDFAVPREQRNYLVGSLPASLAGRAAMVAVRSVYTGLWDVVPIFPGGGFQANFPRWGGEVVALDANLAPVGSATFYDVRQSANHWIEVRAVQDVQP